ncbi:putative sterol-4-alpha-carboxylate 3-dehydrogenase, decarboxylating [Phaeosphaeriaceae sp. SRC1lsM3a]|nr:putative sterol-4-alpha-carboxylate 3-dehydrogenase, decarboxylating [Stagonospora sp. SRC1lsM3a]
MGELGSVFVIGGCGLLGYHIVKCLLESRDATRITIFDINTKLNRVSHPNVTYVTGSITSRAEVLDALMQCKAGVIFNTASPDPLIPDPAILEAVNIGGTRIVLECAMELKIRVLIYTSSSEVVQHGYDDLVFADETWPALENPVGGAVYARTKRIGEELVLRANGNNGLHTLALRPCTLFGECDRVLTKHAVEMSEDGRARFRVGTGKNLYDFIYASNAADAHILAAKKLLRESSSNEQPSDASRVSGEAFFLTNDDPRPFWDFTRAVSAQLGKPLSNEDIWTLPLWVVLPFVVALDWITWIMTIGGRPRITPNMLRYTAQIRTFNISKAKQRLGYEPRVSMEDGINRAVEWHLLDTTNAKKTA